VKIELNRDWTDFLSALISNRVRFVLVGGHAVAGHGEPRPTEDLDVFVEQSPVNARKLRRALVELGFGNVAPTASELARPHKVFMLDHKPWRIDILTSIDGVSFAQAWKSRVEAEFKSAPVRDWSRDVDQEQARGGTRSRSSRCRVARAARKATPKSKTKSRTTKPR
jgi:hypothetical protein